jgi:hypothetical protein
MDFRYRIEERSCSGHHRHDRPQGEAMIPSMRDVFNPAMKRAIRILLLFVPMLAFPAWP